jgi:hypothetical protein
MKFEDLSRTDQQTVRDMTRVFWDDIPDKTGFVGFDKFRQGHIDSLMSKSDADIRNTIDNMARQLKVEGAKKQMKI